MNAPCFNCTERHVGCHAECDKYQAYHAERLKVYEANRKNGDLNDFLESVKRHRNDRNHSRNIAKKRKGR